MPAMKLATYRDGSRDGQLVVVSRDLGLAHYATGIATRLQQALDDWPFIAPQLDDLYQTLNQGKARHAFPFEPRQCMAPLPRAGTRLQAARPGGTTPPPAAADGPAPPPETAAGTASDTAARDAGAATGCPPQALTPCPAQPLLGPCDDLRPGHAAWGVQLDASLCAICGDLEPGADPAQGLDALRLLMLCADAGLRRPPGGPALAHAAWLASACSPVAVTPDELGAAWRGGRLHGLLRWQLNQQRSRQRPLEAWPARHLGQWIADAALTRPLAAGALLGLAVEALGPAEPLQPGDRLRLDLLDPQGASLCGSLDLRVRVAGMADDDAAAGDGAGAGIDGLTDGLVTDAEDTDDTADAKDRAAGTPRDAALSAEAGAEAGTETQTAVPAGGADPAPRPARPAAPRRSPTPRR
jgi:fumarylacetoacetate (FAA) hydrolase